MSISSTRENLLRGAADRGPALEFELVEPLPLGVGNVADAFRLEHRLDGGGGGAPGGEQRAGGEVVEEALRALLRIGFVGPDHPGGATLDPSGAVVAGEGLLGLGIEDPSLLVGEGARLLIKGKAGEREPHVADRTEDQTDRDGLELIGGLGSHRAVVRLDQLVLHDLDCLDLPIADQLDRRDEEAEVDAAALPGGGALRVLLHDLDVRFDRAVGVGSEPFARILIEFRLVGRAGDVGFLHLAEFLDLGIGIGSLGRAAAREHVDVLHLALGQRLHRVVGDVGRHQFTLAAGQDADHVHRDISDADHRDVLLSEIELLLAIVGVGVVPADELGCRVAAREIFTRDAHAAVGLGADGVDDAVVVGLEVQPGEVGAIGYVAKEAEAGVLSHLLVGLDHRLDLLVVRCDAAPHQTEGGRETVVHVDRDREVLGLLQEVRGVEAGGAGTDDCDPQRIRGSADLAHVFALVRWMWAVPIIAPRRWMHGGRKNTPGARPPECRTVSRPGQARREGKCCRGGRGGTDPEGRCFSHRASSSLRRTANGRWTDEEEGKRS
ncbi:MAG: hypothetical protein IPK72_10330 [Candidatus Eisenbacteria bacterium]|nr:hypothetical protein [Candidatus Eisenbacteria bacterium]